MPFFHDTVFRKFLIVLLAIRWTTGNSKINSCNYMVMSLQKLISNGVVHTFQNRKIITMNKITTINGILLTPQNDFTGHTENNTMHVTEAERMAWDAKADASDVASKVGTATFNAHQNDSMAHVTREEREKWNRAPEVDAAGNMSLAGGLTAQSAAFSTGINAGKTLNVAGRTTLEEHSIIHGQLFINNDLPEKLDTGHTLTLRERDWTSDNVAEGHAIRGLCNMQGQFTAEFGGICHTYSGNNAERNGGTAVEYIGTGGKIVKPTYTPHPSGEETYPQPDHVLNMEENDARYGLLAAANTWTHPQTCMEPIDARGGVHVPDPSSSKDALNYDGLLFLQASAKWPLVRRAAYAAIPTWCEIINRWQAARICCRTLNASVQFGGIIPDDWFHQVFTLKQADGLSFLLGATHPWQFPEFIGSYRYMSAWSAAVSWWIANADSVSLMIGSTSHGYGFAPSTYAGCYAHPIHWATSETATYRYPYTSAVNGTTGKEALPGWQITTYGREYLGALSSCLVRGTHYGVPDDEIEYVWSLVPSITKVAVAMAPRRPQDHRDTINRWELWINDNYVLPMTSRFCGSGHTAVVCSAVKAYNVASTRQVGIRMSGMRIDKGNGQGGAPAVEILDKVVMSGVVPKPRPVVEAGALEVSAAGGEVVLEISSALDESVYLLNDTMSGHDPSAVWCRQSTEQVSSSGGTVTLTLAANATGEDREVWVFAGHHYGPASVVKITQAA